MSKPSSLTSIIADLGFTAESQIGEVQARQVIYGGDQELNLLEIGAISEQQLLVALEGTTGLPAAGEGYLPVDFELSRQIVSVEPGIAAGYDEAGHPVVFVSKRPSDDLKQRLDLALGADAVLLVAPRLRISEALAAMDLGRLTVRETGLLDRLGPRPALPEKSAVPQQSAVPQKSAAASPSAFSSQPYAAPASEGPTRTPPDVEERAPDAEESTHALAAPPPPSSAPEFDGGTVRPVRAVASPLDDRPSTPIIETAPPPEGYEQITAASLHPGRKQQTKKPGPRARYAASEAISDLSSAKSRDRAVDVLIHYAAQFFEYTAVFAVLSQEAKGLTCTGSGASTAEVKKLRIPLDLPSAFREAKESSAPKVTRLMASGLEGGIARDLDRPTGREILLLPIGVRGRPVLLLWGDRGASHVDLKSTAELIAFAPAVSQALERLLIEHKRASRVAQPADGFPDTRGSGSFRAFSARPAPLPSAEAPRSGKGAPPSTERNPAAPAAQPPNTESAHEVARAHKRTLSQPRSPEEGSASRSDPPMAFPAEAPRTIRGFPQAKNPNDRTQGFQPSEPERSETKPSMRPALLSRRIVPLNQVVRIQSDPPLPPDELHHAPRISAPPPPPADLVQYDSEPPQHSSRGTLMSRRPQVSEPAEDGWGAPEAPGFAHPRPPGIPKAKPQSYVDVVASLLAGNEAAIDRLVEGGETAIGALIAEFPGPVTEPQDPSVPASACGPILKALAALGSKSIPFLTVRTADEDAKVRRWATFLLGELPGKDAARAIAGRLLDESADVRRAALTSARRARRDVITRRTLRSQMEELCRDRSLAVESRCSAVEALADIREHEAIPTLLQLLDDKDASLVRASRWALSVLTRQDFGADGEAWKKFWRDHRDQDRIEWLIESLDHPQRDLRRAAGDELKSMAGRDFGFDEDQPEGARRTSQAEFRKWWNTEGKSSLA